MCEAVTHEVGSVGVQFSHVDFYRNPIHPLDKHIAETKADNSSTNDSQKGFLLQMESLK